ncbi:MULTISPECIES: phage antirepressor N-terminal domain-containing protein [Paraburkholderia]|uniref:phage antirepressor N-terminal domain-containing protein n=1 Tax=Paraburkholderia TaxID=1822464 RepID=UPI00225047B1|nr:MULTISPECIES: phage antirepressor N-terminal domain-containing protein [Paraburkholderia]MCX4156177.1 phage antirepressor N-terminal domain-containing protein [Paraburkholderia aspalathi]MDN7165583.1 hypothetical protein [Paraburkholderia sp. SECH2]MDQ6394069.1 hypothetical protein [Paraburkholderia aspalathi]
MHPSTRALTRQIKVPFHGAELFVIEHHREPYAPLRPIVDGMGLNWASQFTKIKQRFAACVVEITTQLPGDKQRRSVTCLPVRKLPGWLHSINIGKIRTELRDTVAAYQAECDDALWRYWNDGIAVNPRQPRIGPARSTAADRADALRYATELVIDRRVPYSAAYRVMRLYAGTLSFKTMTCDQVNIATDFAERLLTHHDTLEDWKLIQQHRSELLAGPEQLSLDLHPRLGPTQT